VFFSLSYISLSLKSVIAQFIGVISAKTFGSTPKNVVQTHNHSDFLTIQGIGVQHVKKRWNLRACMTTWYKILEIEMLLRDWQTIKLPPDGYFDFPIEKPLS
jgi:hypothetical protein